MAVEIVKCEECGVDVAKCDNAVLLDVPAVAYDSIPAPMTIMKLGGLDLASAGDPPPSGKGHALHEHQPPEVA